MFYFCFSSVSIYIVVLSHTLLVVRSWRVCCWRFLLTVMHSRNLDFHCYSVNLINDDCDHSKTLHAWLLSKTANGLTGNPIMQLCWGHVNRKRSNVWCNWMCFFKAVILFFRHSRAVEFCCKGNIGNQGRLNVGQFDLVATSVITKVTSHRLNTWDSQWELMKACGWEA